VASGNEAARRLLGISVVQAVLQENAIVDRRGNEVSLRIGDMAVELAFTSQPIMGAEMSRMVHNRLLMAKEAGGLSIEVRRVLVLSSGHVGAIPSPAAPENLISDARTDDLIDGPQSTGERWLSLTRLLEARNSAELRRLVVETLQ
jgi:hypothetical protein